jgi:PPK2 family polyphosphate:nucleotide phosphotransferase
MTKYHLKPGTQVNLDDVKTEPAGKYEKKEALEYIADSRTELSSLQERLYAEGKQSLLIILQGMDTSGKDGVVKHVFSGFNPQGIYVKSFKKPTEEELMHPFLWRINRNVPKPGMIGVFNRSQYEDVLVARVEKLALREEIDSRYGKINDFEKRLAEKDTRILKFFLNISYEEQGQRLAERLSKPDEQWKFSEGDLPVRAKWKEYMRAYEIALTKCNKEYAPWHIIPADKKWHRDAIITHVLLKTLRKMDPQYPKKDLSHITYDGKEFHVKK